MKIIILILIVILIVVFSLKFSKRQNGEKATIGKSDLIENMIDSLMKSTNEYSFLIITIHGTEDFIQFTGDSTGVRLDFPLITDRQKELESYFKEASIKMDLEFVENFGSNDARFLDIDIKGSSSEISNTVKKFIQLLFKTTKNTQFEFTYDL